MNHPINPVDINDENFRQIATDLFAAQCRFLAGYATSMADRYSDDDTDYFRTALNASERLMDISYDGSRDDLVNFLYTPRDDNHVPTSNDNLVDIISAGGLCEELNAYEELIYAMED